MYWACKHSYEGLFMSDERYRLTWASSFKSSPLKPLGQMNRDLVGSIYGRSSIKIAHWQWPFWTEIRVIEHNFGSWPPKDHRWHVCYIGWLVSEEKILKHFFPHRVLVVSFLHLNLLLWIHLTDFNQNCQIFDFDADLQSNLPVKVYNNFTLP
jgi:hypothetical protein